jgi:choline dehydrogenase-like flavoprotein
MRMSPLLALRQVPCELPVKQYIPRWLIFDSDHYEEHIQVPQFIGDDIGSTYDWNVTTTPQHQLDGATRPIPLGKAVGGGSIINGMVWNRGNQDDYNSWQALGNDGWAWNDLLPYFKKVNWHSWHGD